MSASLASTFSAALLDPRLPCPPGLRAWNGSDVARRFAVHRNNVVVSLVDALADAFPVVQALVGDAFFRAMAGVFVRQHPPRSPVLAHYGAALPEFLEGFGPARGVPYLPDVARLERARVEACHAADAPAWSAAAAQQALGSARDLGELRLLPHPSLRLVDSPQPVISIWAAHQGQGALEDVDLLRGEAAVVVRPGLEVLVVRCGRGTAAFADAVRQGVPLPACAACAAAVDPDFDLTASMALLLAHGALIGLAHSGEGPT